MATAVRVGFAREAGGRPFAAPTLQRLEETMRAARRAAVHARHAAEDCGAEAALEVRRHPLAAIGGALTVGAFAGIAIGFGAGWLLKARA